MSDKKDGEKGNVSDREKMREVYKQCWATGWRTQEEDVGWMSAEGAGEQANRWRNDSNV